MTTRPRGCGTFDTRYCPCVVCDAYRRGVEDGTERDALRAQVEAARAWAERTRCAPGGRCIEGSCYDAECAAASRLLAAMDGAKP